MTRNIDEHTTVLEAWIVGNNTRLPLATLDHLTHGLQGIEGTRRSVSRYDDAIIVCRDSIALVARQHLGADKNMKITLFRIVYSALNILNIQARSLCRRGKTLNINSICTLKSKLEGLLIVERLGRHTDLAVAHATTHNCWHRGNTLCRELGTSHQGKNHQKESYISHRKS